MLNGRGGNTRTPVLRRVAILSVAGIIILLGGCAAILFSRNYRLQQDLADAQADLQRTRALLPNDGDGAVKLSDGIWQIKVKQGGSGSYEAAPGSRLLISVSEIQCDSHKSVCRVSATGGCAGKIEFRFYRAENSPAAKKACGGKLSVQLVDSHHPIVATFQISKVTG